jgi:LuxR family maltose regulon positive regulatory protein
MIEESMMYSKSNPNTYIDFFNLNMKAQVYEEMGCFVKAFTVYNQIKTIMEANKSLSSINLSYCVSITGIYLKQMKLTSALSSLETAYQLALEEYSHSNLEALKLAIDHNMIEYHFLNNEVKEADVMLQELMSNSFYENILRASGLLKYLWKNDGMTNVLRDQFITTYEKEEEENRSLNSKLMYARLIYDLRGKEKSLFVIDDVLSYARKSGIRLKIIEASLQKLSILMEQNESGHVPQDLYREAVYYACDDEIKLPFYLEADAVLAVQAQYTPKLSENFSTKERSFELSILKLCNSGGSGLLSNRELEVLKEIALGHTNKEIGECLCISLATVKTHIINIYRKLEINTRVGAVEAARRLGIEI